VEANFTLCRHNFKEKFQIRKKRKGHMGRNLPSEPRRKGEEGSSQGTGCKNRAKRVEPVALKGGLIIQKREEIMVDLKEKGKEKTSARKGPGCKMWKGEVKGSNESTTGVKGNIMGDQSRGRETTASRR